MTREDYRLNLLNCRTKDCKTEVRISYIKSLEQQVASLNSNLEAQEIMIADYKKRIEELEAPKNCDGCAYQCNKVGECFGYIDGSKFKEVQS